MFWVTCLFATTSLPSLLPIPIVSYYPYNNAFTTSEWESSILTQMTCKYISCSYIFIYIIDLSRIVLWLKSYRKTGRAVLRYQCCCEFAEIDYDNSVGRTTKFLLTHYWNCICIEKIVGSTLVSVFWLSHTPHTNIPNRSIPSIWFLMDVFKIRINYFYMASSHSSPFMCSTSFSVFIMSEQSLFVLLIITSMFQYIFDYFIGHNISQYFF